MKKLAKVGIALALIGTIGGGAALAAASTFAKEDGHVLSEVNTDNKTYQGEKIIKGTTTRGVEFKYSDGLFKSGSKLYNPHMATVSCVLTRASDNVVSGEDYSKGGSDLADMYKQMGYENIYISDSYKVKPTTKSIACVIASKQLSTGKKVIALTVRSAGYDAEWASNVTLGKEGEAQGFREASEQILGYLDDFVKQNNLQKELDSGNVKFWLSGFSRGAATANLAAKKLVDKYQPQGNEMYAYCIESPAGGVQSEVRADRDYEGIHYIINQDDLVTHVAPEVMGFIHYGVCHYLVGTEATTKRMDWYKKNNADYVADNSSYMKGFHNGYEKQEALFMEQSKAIKSDDMPFQAKRYRFDFQDFEIEEVDDSSYCSLTFNHNVMDFLTKETTRAQYVDEGIEKAASNLLDYTNNGGLSVDGIVEALTKDKSLYDLLPVSGLISSLDGIYYTSTGNIFKDMYKLLFDRDDIKINVYLSADDIEKVASGFVDNLFSVKLHVSELFNLDNLKKIYDGEKSIEEVVTKGFSLSEVFAKYPGGLAQAKTDAKSLLKFALKSVHSIDDVVTIAKNIGNIVDNHSISMTEAWLRTYDSWFEKTVIELEV